ncbi:MAG: hypothetical protein KGY76_06325 [Candidatus Thermoplasmatota archaeon]|nr:hypothetical protein [Candidatus Thermoplasmatota archaeon]
MKGWILDIYPDLNRKKIVIWIRTKKGCYRIREDYAPPFYFRGKEGRSKELEGFYESKGFRTRYVKRKAGLHEESPKKLLKITPPRLFDPRDQLEAWRFFQGYEENRFYNVDIPLAQRYLIEKGVKPFSLVEKNSGWRELEEDARIHYSKPPLRTLRVKIEAEKNGRLKKGELEKIKLNGEEIGGKEIEVIEGLNRTLERKDPDVLLTQGGDSPVIPYLFHRAEVNDLELKLGRESSVHPSKSGSTYESYGRVIYKPPSYPLKGRLHIDVENSFLFQEGGLDGLIELSRLAKIPLQRLARRSPGSLINAMEVEQALKEDYLIPWKRNIGEDFKSGKHLIDADRGGHTFEPKVGVHEDVIKLDFASMYPSIIDEYNLSPETLGCRCGNYREVPELGYRVCKKERGLIPKVVKPIIERRQEYKRLSDKNQFFKRRADVLKWLLVTCFGYTGYKKARFNCIEVHESITAYGRKILLEASELAQEKGFELIHGIVDSLWLKGKKEKIEELLKKVKKKTKIQLEREGTYDWVVFLPSKNSKVGALNRYYGILDDELEVKGLYMKRSDVPAYFKKTQKEMLEEMKTASCREELEGRVEKALKAAKERWRRLKRGDAAVNELYFTKTVSKKPERYTHMTETKAALLRYKDLGVNLRPGQEVEYILKEDRDDMDKVRVKGEDPESYDKRYYEDYLFRTVEEVLRPFGFDLKEVKKRLKQVNA